MASSPSRYPTETMRPGILPGVLGAIAALLGLWLFDSDWFYAVKIAVAIFAAILVVMCFQARTRAAYVAVVLLLAVVVVWNPVVDVTGVFRGGASQIWMFVELAAAAILLWAGIIIRTPLPKNR